MTYLPNVEEIHKSMEELKIRFKYHAPKPGQPEKYVAIRDKAFELAKMIDEMCPESREKTLSLTSLDEVVFWANSAIARREK